ncbi:MAG: hypothetical protein O4859_18380 [Trichodesmium sp. St18_bin1]|nr:hypothetical protein [Trichodesmium sp. St18_bin1]
MPDLVSVIITLTIFSFCPKSNQKVPKFYQPIRAALLPLPSGTPPEATAGIMGISGLGRNKIPSRCAIAPSKNQSLREV